MVHVNASFRKGESRYKENFTNILLTANFHVKTEDVMQQLYLIGLLTTNHIIAYITMAYRGF